MFRFIHNRTLKFKLLFTYFLLIAVPVISISIYFTMRLTSVVKQNSEAQAELFVSQFKENINQRLNSYYELVNIIGKNPFIIYMTELSFNGDYEALQYYINYVQPLIAIIENRISNVSIRIFSEKKAIPFSRITNNSFTDLPFYEFPPLENLEFPGINWFTTSNSALGSKKKLCAFFLLRDRSDFTNYSAVVSLFFYEEEIFSLISKEVDENNIVFLLNDKKEIVTTTERQVLAENDTFSSTGITDTLYLNTKSKYISYNSNRYILVRDSVEQPDINIFGWEIVYLKNVNPIFSFINSVWITSSIVCLISILASFMIVFILISSITTRFSEVIHKIENIKTGNYSLPRSPQKKDEFGILEESFDNMMERIDHLVNSVFAGEINRNKLEVEKREAELIALRNQINPHFLFNTLETVRMNLVSKKDKENADMVKLIADNFRITLAGKGKNYTLKDELTFVDNYVKIQRFRFKDKISYKKDIPKDLLSVTVPELIIQPLIENSYYHGLEKKLNAGTVTLKIEQKEKRLFVNVTDNGIGIDKIKLDELNTLIFNNTDPHVDINTRKMALKNIYSRLYQMYGDRLNFSIDSKLNNGTEINFSFPLPEKQQTDA